MGAARWVAVRPGIGRCTDGLSRARPFPAPSVRGAYLRSPCARPMPVATVCNHKGGSGKTTTAVMLAAAFGKTGRRVLVIDFDPQGFLSHTLGIAEPAPARSALALVDPGAGVGRVSDLPVHVTGGFDVLPASQSMTRAQRSLGKPTDVFLLREALARGHDYDLVVIDTAAAVSVFTLNALVASDEALIPVTPEYQPVVGAEQTWATCSLVRDRLNPSLAEPRFLLTQVDARKRNHAGFGRYVRDTYAHHVLGAVVRTSSVLAETARDGRTAFDTALASRGARDYALVADELRAAYFPAAPAPSGDGAEAAPAGVPAWSLPGST